MFKFYLNIINCLEFKLKCLFPFKFLSKFIVKCFNGLSLMVEIILFATLKASLLLLFILSKNKVSADFLKFLQFPLFYFYYYTTLSSIPNFRPNQLPAITPLIAHDLLEQEQ
ncbi:unnamed protein product [Meloidogyne enterolobii]|uniref:Uncharacterized protein n=1 Tax=Meloidogyne enterolobii TaxID=390850 RepID=A0ACB0Z535_MELEN